MIGQVRIGFVHERFRTITDTTIIYKNGKKIRACYKDRPSL